MKVLWITGMKVPFFKDNKIDTNVAGSGGWITSTIKAVSNLYDVLDDAADDDDADDDADDDVAEFTVISISPDYKYESKKSGKITVIHVGEKVTNFFGINRLKIRIQETINCFNPDIVDVQGIEFNFAYIIKDITLNCPVIYTLQGLPSELGKVYNLGIPLSTLVFGRTISDNLRLKGLLEHQYIMNLRGKKSIEVLKSAKYVTGRTSWDCANVYKYNPKLKYYHVDRLLRDEFYTSSQWNFENVKKHSIFTIQGDAPYKGIHILLEAIAILKSKYPDIKLTIPGYAKDKEKISQRNGYTKYLMYIIQHMGIKDCVQFSGPLNATQMIDKLLNSHLFILPSILENSPNSLAEAQILGVPCVATFAGGTIDYIKNENYGLLYNCLDSAMCAKQIERLFSDECLAKKISCNGKELALLRHNKSVNIHELINTYRCIIADKK